MKIVLSAIEARVVGCLLEKQLTTPEQYPMSLNGVVVACNQKTNREPVLALSESEVLDTLKVLEKKHLVTAQSGFGQRVVKYEHRFCNTEFGELKLNEEEFALVTTLLLRGPQTPGELRSRSQRLHDFDDMARVEQTLELLAARSLVVRLTREPGKRESRYMHLFSGDVNEAMHDAMSGVEPVSDPQGLAARVTVLEREMAELRQQLAELSDKSS